MWLERVRGIEWMESMGWDIGPGWMKKVPVFMEGGRGFSQVSCCCCLCVVPHTHGIVRNASTQEPGEKVVRQAGGGHP